MWGQQGSKMRTKSYEPTPERKTFAEYNLSDLDEILSAGDMDKPGDTPLPKNK